MTKWRSNDFLYVKLRTRLDTIHSKAMEVLLKGSIRGNWNNELGYKPIIQKESPYTFSIKDGLTRDGNKEEIRMDIPNWLEFMKEYYPDCLE